MIIKAPGRTPDKGVRRKWVCNRRIRAIGKVSPSPVLSMIPRVSPYTNSHSHPSMTAAD